MILPGAGHHVSAAVLLPDREDSDVLEVVDDQRSAELLKSIRAKALVDVLVRPGTSHVRILADYSDRGRVTSQKGGFVQTGSTRRI